MLNKLLKRQPSFRRDMSDGIHQGIDAQSSSIYIACISAANLKNEHRPS